MPDRQSDYCQQLILEWDPIIRHEVSKMPPLCRDDVAQDSRLKLLAKPNHLVTARDPRKYVAQVVWNCFRQEQRATLRRSRRLTITDPNCLLGAPATSGPSGWDIRSAVGEALNSLPSPYREVVLSELHGEPLAEVARRNNVSLGACRVRLSRAKKLLSKMSLLQTYRDER